MKLLGKSKRRDYRLKVLWEEGGKWDRKSKIAKLRQNKIITLLQQLEAVEQDMLWPGK